MQRIELSNKFLKQKKQNLDWPIANEEIFAWVFYVKLNYHIL